MNLDLHEKNQGMTIIFTSRDIATEEMIGYQEQINDASNFLDQKMDEYNLDPYCSYLPVHYLIGQVFVEYPLPHSPVEGDTFSTMEKIQEICEICGC